MCVLCRYVINKAIIIIIIINSHSLCCYLFNDYLQYVYIILYSKFFATYPGFCLKLLQAKHFRELIQYVLWLGFG